MSKPAYSYKQQLDLLKITVKVANDFRSWKSRNKGMVLASLNV